MLLFVYNADSGMVNALKDYVHKAVSPSTYECQLCALTYGGLGMKGSWARFVDSLDMPVEFLHKDELRERHGVDDVPLPAVLVWTGDDTTVLISADEINRLRILEDLEALVSSRVDGLRERGQRP
jgi:hypothetical protein